ncbi:hypothetical protein NA57DRAFT_41462 [Rhizodiscina lignyota]|uniref:Pre-mRNA-splicing factor n=1 Tax=Rhizodiscina lignyota TaxID=1504668 RepID=A0A9P4ID90_9PEZI|nr:hypothetical protein NA57DRAFT_41462 [Rhizodiscina lignyota]
MDPEPRPRSSNGSTVPIVTSQGNFSALHARPTVSDLHGENQYAQFARKHWLKAKKAPTVKSNILKSELWDSLEKDGFSYGSLLILENLQVLEKYLWPGFSEEASNYHILLVAIFVNVKRREGLPAWDLFGDRPDEFSYFFRRILNLILDQSLPQNIRIHLISFIVGAFQSLDIGLVRKELAPLVSISIWHNLHSERVREAKLEANQVLKRAWRASGRRFDAADDETKSRQLFERSWLFTLLLEFLDKVYDTSKEGAAERVLFCERLLELLIDLQSQLPTRRYVNALIQDLNLSAAVRLSHVFNHKENGLFRDLFNLFDHYTSFPIEDQSGQQRTSIEDHQSHYAALSKLQRIAIKQFGQKLKLLALANYGALESRKDLEDHLSVLDMGDLERLCTLLDFRTEYPRNSLIPRDRDFFTELIISSHERKPTFRDEVRDFTIVPTEQSLYEETFLRDDTYNGSRPLAIPKLNLQYLTMGDFLWRAFILYRSESFYGIRKHVEDTIRRVQASSMGTEVRFDGFSRMALPIPKVAVQDISSADVGEEAPAQVRGEVILDVSRLNFTVRQEWESLRPDDVVFLAAVRPPAAQSRMMLTNGSSAELQTEKEKLGLQFLRTAEVLQIQDENGRPLRERSGGQANGHTHRVRQRRLILKLDPVAYQHDMDRVAKGEMVTNPYERINLIIRRRGRENNFKPILESIKRLTLSDVPAPAWLQDVFLGYGDPAGATYKRLPNRLQSIDFRDTFTDWQHLIESLPGKVIEPSEDVEGSFGPPYVLETKETEEAAPAPRPSKKRRRDEDPPPAPVVETIKVSTYKPPNTGPYPTDIPKTNQVRFTPSQIEAITSGTQPGLTIIVGPPGTGKTDVATQIINNIYHNFPSQRTLLVAHSNQALNQLFQKIVALDIDERHLLRLGHGEEELVTEGSYSKYGRVESFLELGQRYLAEVHRLAVSISAQGAHGSTCETADYFNSVYIKPAWTKYWNLVQSDESDLQQIVETFPFHAYFSNAPQPLFPPGVPKEKAVEIAAGCYRHIEKIFSELEDIRPFEILRNPRDKANYLLIKEARIIAMTSTHAAMRRQEISDLGFHYDNVVMEEAAQITEIENFIPMALQKPQDGQVPLQRVVLCGDHLQNSPIIENLAFRQYANLEQSLFLRLVRLGVPTIMLDQQGRARPSLAELYKWRYPKLGNLPTVETLPEFVNANAGFRYEYQFIDVPDYKGRGEMEPTPHFIQNLGEAEYVVAMYMYMRLLGYPANKISILTTYAGQRALIRDVLTHRCKDNRLFGMPRIVATVDKYQGEQNDYILLSLVRTSRVGYLRDIRRLTVALSRARLGLYVFGRREVFESAYELKEAFDLLLQHPTKLTVVTNEMYPTSRVLVDKVEKGRMAEMEGVEHLGQYVFEMTQAKVKALKEGGGMLPPVAEVAMKDADLDDDEVGLINDEVEEEMGPEIDEETYV